MKIWRDKECSNCGSSNVVRDAWASWDVGTQSWVLEEVFDNEYCRDCEQSGTMVDTIVPPEDERIPK